MSLPVGIAIELGQVAQVANSAIGEWIQYTQDTSYRLLYVCMYVCMYVCSASVIVSGRGLGS